MTSANEKLAEELFLLVESDQGKAFISDGLGNQSRETIMGIARASLLYSENVCRKLRKWIKRNSSERSKS
jgi:hypothetical protein